LSRARALAADVCKGRHPIPQRSFLRDSFPQDGFLQHGGNFRVKNDSNLAERAAKSRRHPSGSSESGEPKKE